RGAIGTAKAYEIVNERIALETEDPGDLIHILGLQHFKLQYLGAWRCTNVVDILAETSRFRNTLLDLNRVNESTLARSAAARPFVDQHGESFIHSHPANFVLLA